MQRPGNQQSPEPSGSAFSGFHVEASLEGYFAAASRIPAGPWSGALSDAEVPQPHGGPPQRGAQQVVAEAWAKQLDNGGRLLDEDGFFDLVADNARRALARHEGREAGGSKTDGGDADSNNFDGDATPSEEDELDALRRQFHLNVLRSAPPQTIPRPAHVTVAGRQKPVHRIVPLTAEEQANYSTWTPQLGTAALDATDPASLDAGQLLDYIEATERLASWAMARQAAAINEFSARRPPVPGEGSAKKHPDRSGYAAAEIMAMFAIGPGAAEHLMADAELLARHLPDTFEQYSDGSGPWPNATIPDPWNSGTDGHEQAGTCGSPRCRTAWPAWARACPPRKPRC